MFLVIGTYATKRYKYALPNFGRRISASIVHSKIPNGLLLFIGDESEEIEKASKKYVQDVLPAGWDFKLIQLPIEDEKVENYKEDAQFLIAKLQSTAFTEARRLRATHFWSVESDVLVPPNALSVSLDCLNFDNGYYDVAMCSYPSQGGGPFLGGRGTPQNQIAEDFSPEEKDVPKKLLSEINKREKESKKEGFEPSEEWIKRGSEINEKIKECPPKGNVFDANAKKWRKRGWMEYAYPAIGKGAIVPTDWVGFGCTMLSERALSLAHFDGYEGKGTQDLYIGWRRWKQAGLEMCVTTHAICDHVVRKRDGENQLWEDFILVHVYHETEGECEGHLRQVHIPFHTISD